MSYSRIDERPSILTRNNMINLIKKLYISTEGLLAGTLSNERTKSPSPAANGIKIKLDVEAIKCMDLLSLSSYTFAPYSGLFMEEAGANHYKMLAYLSEQLENETFIDIGTYHGNSALALSKNTDNKVITYDLKDFLPKEKKTILDRANIRFVLADGCKEPVGNSRVIMLDVDPHDGRQERKYIKKLIRDGYSGLLILDDIHIKRNRYMQRLWDSIRMKKIDATSVGHSSGTGIIVFDENVIDIDWN